MAFESNGIPFPGIQNDRYIKVGDHLGDFSVYCWFQDVDQYKDLYKDIFGDTQSFV